MFTLTGHPLKDVYLKVDPAQSDVCLAIKGVFLVEEDKELTLIGMILFISENKEVLQKIVTEAHEMWLEMQSPAPSATVH
jgi:hypothetical protein